MNEWILCVITKSDFNFYFCNFIPRGALSVITHSSVSMKLCNFNLQPQFHELIFTLCKQLLGFNFHTCRVALEQNFLALSQVTFMCAVGFTVWMLQSSSYWLDAERNLDPDTCQNDRQTECWTSATLPDTSTTTTFNISRLQQGLRYYCNRTALATISSITELTTLISLTLWCPLLPYGYSYRGSCARLG